MSDHHGPHDDHRHHHGGHRDAGGEHADHAHDQVGSVAEEAVKLFGALADLARTQVGGAGDLAGQVAGMARQVDEHLATDDPECRYCPVCRVVHAVRATSPEVKAHLAVAASSLVQAAAGLLEAVQQPTGADGDGAGPGQPRGSTVEHIDLDDLDDVDDLGDSGDGLRDDPGGTP